jgi:hypothetical protein
MTTSFLLFFVLLARVSLSLVHLQEVALPARE